MIINYRYFIYLSISSFSLRMLRVKIYKHRETIFGTYVRTSMCNVQISTNDLFNLFYFFRFLFRNLFELTYQISTQIFQLLKVNHIYLLYLLHQIKSQSQITKTANERRIIKFIHSLNCSSVTHNIDQFFQIVTSTLYQQSERHHWLLLVLLEITVKNNNRKKITV